MKSRNHRRPVLLIIPGIGDDSSWAYQLFVHIWGWLGFETSLIAFGWRNINAAYEPKLAAFLQLLDAYADRDVYLIGVSAGGTVAVNALAARPTLVRKIITVCAPLDRLPGLRNPLLAESIEATRAHLAHFSPAQKGRILSVRAWRDQVVNTALSEPAGVPKARVWFIGHVASIFVALTFMAPRLRQFFR